MGDQLSDHYATMLEGHYDCVDRIVLNAYNPLCYSPGGFRCWWRRLYGTDDQLDDAHLMRMAGRFSRRVHGFAKGHGLPIEECQRGERKHDRAEQYLAAHPGTQGLFLILVSRAVAPVWEVQRAVASAALHLVAKKAFVNHYSFHILDADWGHVTIKMSGHPPFGAQIILNGHEHVAAQALRAGTSFTKDGNCFTHLSDPGSLAAVADTLTEKPVIGQLLQVCERWIYSCCLCFGLHTEEQERTNFRYQYSVYQLEYSRNLLFRSGQQLDQVFQGLIDRTRSRLDIPHLRTIFGTKQRPQQRHPASAPREAVVLERPTYDLTVFKVHFGKVTLKAYTKGARVLRFEAIVHNAAALGMGRVLPRFPALATRLRGMIERWLDTIQYLDRAFVADETLDQLPTSAQLGQSRIGGIDLNKPRMRAVLTATIACAQIPLGFRLGDVVRQVRLQADTLAPSYGTRQAAYDLRKLRAKGFVLRVDRSRRYQVPPDGLRTIAALVVLREQVIKPLLAAARAPHVGQHLTSSTPLDDHLQSIRKDMHLLFADLGLAS